MDELHATIAAFLHRRAMQEGGVREVAIYARVAPTESSNAIPLDEQVRVCRAYVRLGVDMAFLIFREVHDGDTLERSGLTELRRAIAHGRVAVVLVTTLDRLTPDPLLLATLRAEWIAAEVAIIAIMGQ
jgi:DNA invertase Pin-like site-specific DNA recombinase